MQLLLTDRLACPRCGPSFGLILLADRLVDRRVSEGLLGCPNCRDSFTIRDGFADLRAPPRGDLVAGLAGGPTDEREGGRGASDLLALLGIERGPGTVALVGEPARRAAEFALGVEDLGVVGVDADLRAWEDVSGVSRIVASPGLPFFSRTLRGVVLDGRLGAPWIAEACRTVAPMSRVVVVRAPVDATEIVSGCGLSVLAEEAETVVAARG